MNKYDLDEELRKIDEEFKVRAIIGHKAYDDEFRSRLSKQRVVNMEDFHQKILEGNENDQKNVIQIENEI